MNIYMFPGQGSQTKGMGKDLFNLYTKECEVASNILGYDIVDLCLNDPGGNLNKTYYTQPALYFVSCLSYLNDHDRTDYLIGHSLGLYAALYAANVFSLEEGLKIVAKRAELMSQISNGSMLAVIGTNISSLEDILISMEFYDIDIANYNSDNQIVLSGKKPRLMELQPKLEDLSYRAILLPVNGAFHSRYMKEATTIFFDFLAKQTFRDMQIPVISTTTGEILSLSHLIEELAYQLIKPVRWRHVISNLKKKEPTFQFKEIGPGNVLTSLNRQIN